MMKSGFRCARFGFTTIIVASMLMVLPAYAGTDFYQQWHDKSYDKGFEEGKVAEVFAPEARYKAYETDIVHPAYKELQTSVEHQMAAEMLEAAKKGFYAGYRAGYYRDKEGEIVEVLEKKYRHIKIFNFKFGKMDEAKDIVVIEQTDKIQVPSEEGSKSYFGYTFDYAGNQNTDKLVVVITLPGKPLKDLGPNFYPSTNSVISEHKIDRGDGHFGNKWYFSKGDLTGKFRLAIYVDGKLIHKVWFDVVGG